MLLADQPEEPEPNMQAVVAAHMSGVISLTDSEKHGGTVVGLLRSLVLRPKLSCHSPKKCNTGHALQLFVGSRS